MASVVGLTIIKRFTYRGDENEEWSNTYHLSGAVPADSAAWDDLFGLVAANEKQVYPPTTLITRAYGYDSDADNAPAVWTKDLRAADEEIPGGLTGWGTLLKAPGAT